jgi:cell division protease FtsH
VKVTIVPRGQSLGAAWYLPEERSITTFEQLLDEMCAALGGRAAEEVTFGKISTGALSDLEKITKQAYAMVTIYGLNDKIGNISFYDSSGQSEYSFNRPYSEKTAETIDQEVKKLIDMAYERTKKILQENKTKLDSLATILLEREVIFREDLEEIFGKRIWDKDDESASSDISRSYKDQLKDNQDIAAANAAKEKSEVKIEPSNLSKPDTSTVSKEEEARTNPSEEA